MKPIRIVLITLAMALLAAGVGNAEMRGHPRLRAAVLHDRDCVKACRGDVGDCVSPAAQALGECVTPCADERAAAQAACSDDPTTTACSDARAALRECVGPCLKAYDAAVDACTDDGKQCVADCPPASDVPCVRACLRDRAECLADLRTRVMTCRDRCASEVIAARDVCREDPESDACRAAAAAAKVCLAPCGDLARTGLQECRQETRTCLDDCDTAGDPTAGGTSAAQ